ncbi:lysylphosphatidylglycerol synthase transmembrane domain-containing protein [Cellulomonas sp. URHE0023]|uniref:lysylphosphatidylglycerol synthase transmembrane domain-containing protein n=1 Tax=Cellulomonas sp. URHE0023 TaxID=1380354 RepID=UPI0006922E83|nr:lysylphosphatidylglycerol synthase transmembrane domain-containing protein [Cellulomonas sp. URHE0023]
MQPTPEHATSRRTRARWLKTAGAVLVVGFVAVFVAGQWSEIVDAVRRLDAASLAGSLGFVLVGLAAAALSWRAVLAGMGSPLPVSAAARVYFLSQLGKYIPGSIWPVLAQTELSTEYGVPRARAASAALTQLVVGLVVGIVVAGSTLSVASADAVRAYWWLLFVAVAGIVMLVPPVFNRVVALARRVLRRPGSDEISGRTLVRSSAWAVLMWVAFGAHLWLLAAGSGVSSAKLGLLTTGAYALAWVVGFVIVVLPAGAGAREAALVLALSPVMDRSTALALALVSRALMIAGDFLSAGAAVLAENRHRAMLARRAPGSTPRDDQ